MTKVSTIPMKHNHRRSTCDKLLGDDGGWNMGFMNKMEWDDNDDNHKKKLIKYSPLPLLFLVRYRHERFQHPIPFFEVSKNISTKHHLMFSTPNLRNVIQNWMEVEHLNKKFFFFLKFIKEEFATHVFVIREEMLMDRLNNFDHSIWVQCLVFFWFSVCRVKGGRGRGSNKPRNKQTKSCSRQSTLRKFHEYEIELCWGMHLQAYVLVKTHFGKGF